MQYLKTVFRDFLTVITGFGVWLFLWVLSVQLLPVLITAPAEGLAAGRGNGYLLLLVGLNLVFSAGGGAATAAASRRQHLPRAAAAVGAQMLFAGFLMIQSEIGYPSWFRLSFLLFMIPAELLGARLAMARQT